MEAAPETEQPSKQKRRTAILSDTSYELLANSAEAFGTNPERLAEDLVHRCGVILASQTPEAIKPAPWWGCSDIGTSPSRHQGDRHQRFRSCKE